MRISVCAAIALMFAIAPAQAQKVPVWRFAQGQKFVLPKCVAPAKLVEMRTSTGRIFWRCVTPR